VELFNSPISAPEAEIQKVIELFRFESSVSLRDSPINVEISGSRQVWWIWDRGYPEETVKLIFGFIDLNPESPLPESPIKVRVVCCLDNLISIWLELVQKLQLTFYPTKLGFGFPAPVQDLLTQSSVGGSAFQAKQNIINSSISSRGVIFPNKPSRQAPISDWFDYYHVRMIITEENTLVQGYTLRNMADDSKRSYSNIRKRHMNCQVCKEKRSRKGTKKEQ